MKNNSNKQISIFAYTCHQQYCFADSFLHCLSNNIDIPLDVSSADKEDMKLQEIPPEPDDTRTDPQPARQLQTDTQPG